MCNYDINGNSQYILCLRDVLSLTGVPSDVPVLSRAAGLSGLTSAITGCGHFSSSSSPGITLAETDTRSGVTGLGEESTFGEFLGDTVDAIVEGCGQAGGRHEIDFVYVNVRTQRYVTYPVCLVFLMNMIRMQSV